ncbi:MAG: hypothetical protein FJ109_08860 [Deltaproteobacteria bacterium]|nr:hypothetical protein [Deltaproteobacteria bacterium]
MGTRSKLIILICWMVTVGCGGNGHGGEADVAVEAVECVPRCGSSYEGWDHCGSDGCGGTCGTCPTGTECRLFSDEGRNVCGVSDAKCHEFCLEQGAECGTLSVPFVEFVHDRMCACSSICLEGDVCGESDVPPRRVCFNPATECPGICAAAGAACGEVPTGLQSPKECDCGQCADGTECENGKCICPPDCQGKECGPDGCGGKCGECAVNEVCTIDAKCQCIASCKDKECGDDGCGGNCGTCPEGQACNAQGKCE